MWVAAMKATFWHNFAQLYLIGELDLSEIVKTMIINSRVGVFGDDDENAIPVGINVLDNSGLNDAMILGFLLHQPSDQPITYSTLGGYLKKSPQTAAGSIQRWIARGVLTKEDRGVLGAVYTIHDEMTPKLPSWLLRFTEAIIQLQHDPELRAAVEEQTANVRFQRGLEIMRQEVSEKFYRRSKRKKK